jgi:hypothetical protein
MPNLAAEKPRKKRRKQKADGRRRRRRRKHEGQANNGCNYASQVFVNARRENRAVFLIGYLFVLRHV